MSRLIPVLPLRAAVFFPGVVDSLYVGRSSSVKATQVAMDHDSRHIICVAQKSSRNENPDVDDLFDTGTLCEILQVLKLPDGNFKILLEGQARVALADKKRGEIFEANYSELSPVKDSVDTTSGLKVLETEFVRYCEEQNFHSTEAIKSIQSATELTEMLQSLAYYLPAAVSIKQSILEENDQNLMLEHVMSMMTFEAQKQKIRSTIDDKTRQAIEKTQRDFYLNEQMKVLRQELNQEEDELGDYKLKIDAANMPAEAKERALKELSRLDKTPPVSAESTVIRTYLDWLCELPWNKHTRDNPDIEKAQSILDSMHHGLGKPKDRLLEYIAVTRLTGQFSGPILCLYGPPGVGKTSLATSLAKSLGRKFVRISLGGVRDEAEIRGHRRTYIGAMPGKIIQSIRKAGVRNPVILLDEIDKLSSDMRGDPASALLEVLDPQQNSNFQDHYLEQSFDLSKVLFICTANAVHKIPAPLLDRMELIELSSYTEDEKLTICRQFLWPKALERNGLKDVDIKVDDDTIRSLIRSYTREAGVRNLDRFVDSLLRKIARRLVEGQKQPFEIKADEIAKWLGPQVFSAEMRNKLDEPGCVNGLAWTESGGSVLSIETLLFPGEEKFTLTGNLGDVMKESAQTALSWIKSWVAKSGGEWKKSEIHIHIPEGAIPKDGPSAGITLATAIYSAFLQKPARLDVAMTGEITLTGTVLPVGGIKEKVLAAHRHGIREVILPDRNEKDISEIPPKIASEMKFHLVHHYSEVLKIHFPD